jgi:hypothetical protein
MTSEVEDSLKGDEYARNSSSRRSEKVDFIVTLP